MNLAVKSGPPIFLKILIQSLSGPAELHHSFLQAYQKIELAVFHHLESLFRIFFNQLLWSFLVDLVESPHKLYGLFFIPASMLLDKLLNYPPVSNLYNIIVQSAPAQKTRSELDYFCVSFNVWRSVNFCIPLVKPSVSGMLRLIIPEYSSEACQFYRQRSSSVC